MSLLQRVSSSITRAPLQRLIALPSEHATEGRGERELSRDRFPEGVFAALYTDPDDIADAAYVAFRHFALTPTLAEREVLRLLRGRSPRCLPVETTPACVWDVAREEDEAGKLRVFVHHLVRMQLIHETNQRELARLRATSVRRVRVLPGCCAVCDQLAGRPYRVSGAPPLPVHGCQRQGGCTCGWVGD